MADEPFAYTTSKDGVVRITYAGRVVTVLRGRNASKLVDRLAVGDARSRQQLLARATGQFKFGNERMAQEKRRSP